MGNIFLVLKAYLNGLVALRENIQQVCRRYEVKARESKTFGFQILSQGLLAKWQPTRTNNIITHCFCWALRWVKKIYRAFSRAPNRALIDVFFSWLSRINHKFPHSSFSAFFYKFMVYLDFLLLPYIICRLWDHFSQTFITHLSCKFSSFSYSPSLLQQFTTFGISAASFINSYKNSAGKLQLYSSLHPVQRTLNSTGAYNYNGKRFQTIAILPKSVLLHKKKMQSIYGENVAT